MGWTTNLSVADWIREQVDSGENTFGTVHGVVPRGFEAYARIFHPAEVRADGGEWSRVRWAEVADAFGTTMHPLAQWYRLVQATSYAPGAVTGPDGREYASPQTGSLTPDQLTDIAHHLVVNTSTPSSGVVAIWDGYSDLDDDFPGGPRLQLPGRNYVVATEPPSLFGAADWPASVPWQDRRAQSPNILWPDDHAWVLVSDIDFDSTIVGGSQKLIDELVADHVIEALQLPPDANLAVNGDTVNPDTAKPHTPEESAP